VPWRGQEVDFREMALSGSPASDQDPRKRCVCGVRAGCSARPGALQRWPWGWVTSWYNLFALRRPPRLRTRAGRVGFRLCGGRGGSTSRLCSSLRVPRPGGPGRIFTPHDHRNYDGRLSVVVTSLAKWRTSVGWGKQPRFSPKWCELVLRKRPAGRWTREWTSSPTSVPWASWRKREGVLGLFSRQVNLWAARLGRGACVCVRGPALSQFRRFLRRIEIYLVIAIGKYLILK
jgi:hypothetical protein